MRLACAETSSVFIFAAAARKEMGWNLPEALRTMPPLMSEIGGGSSQRRSHAGEKFLRRLPCRIAHRWSERSGGHAAAGVGTDRIVACRRP